jgi:hypothetical protein
MHGMAYIKILIVNSFFGMWRFKFLRYEWLRPLEDGAITSKHVAVLIL